jgi:polyisoprenoid-binding protein YceI
VVATGSIRRSNYGMDRWKFAVSEDVRFSLRMRVRRDDGA